MKVYIQKFHFPGGSEGTGSAEQTGHERADQKTPGLALDSDQRKDVAEQADLKSEEVGDVQETGMLSGRDDLAGGSGDQMERTSDNESTDRV